MTIQNDDSAEIIERQQNVIMDLLQRYPTFNERGERIVYDDGLIKLVRPTYVTKEDILHAEELSRRLGIDSGLLSTKTVPKSTEAESCFENFTEAERLLEDVTAQIEKVVRLTGERYFVAVARELFEQNPLLQSVGWRQYTPYYNDGDECEFGSRRDVDNGLAINGYTSDDLYDWDKWDRNSREIPLIPEREQFKPLFGVVEKWLHQHFSDSLLLRLFGDHAAITVNRDGITIEDISDKHE